MAHSNEKKVKRAHTPIDKEVRFGGDPDGVYKQKPSWEFTRCDQQGKWAFSKENVGVDFWEKVFPFLRSIGTQTWNQILLESKKQHHTIDVQELNKCARDRLKELHIECDEVISLRVSGAVRI